MSLTGMPKFGKIQVVCTLIYHECSLETLLGDPSAVASEVLNAARNIDEAQKSGKLWKLQKSADLPCVSDLSRKGIYSNTFSPWSV